MSQTSDDARLAQSDLHRSAPITMALNTTLKWEMHTCCRYVSVTMKALPKEQLLGLTSASAAAGSPRQAGSPKIRRPSTLGLAVAGFPSSAPEPEPQAGPPKGGAALLGRGRKNGKVSHLHGTMRFSSTLACALLGASYFQSHGTPEWGLVSFLSLMACICRLQLLL